MNIISSFRHTILMLAITAVMLFVWRYNQSEAAEVAFILAACCAVGSVLMFFLDTIWCHYEKDLFGTAPEARDDA
jgi:hypothetical protein